MNAKDVKDVLIITGLAIGLVVAVFEGRKKIIKANYEADKISQDHRRLREETNQNEADGGNIVAMRANSAS